MPPRTRNTASTGGRSTTPATSRRASSGPVRVWSEASVTIAVSENPNQYLKFTHGFEKMAPNDSSAAIARTEREIYEACERVLDRRVKRIARLIREMEAQV